MNSRGLDAMLTNQSFSSHAPGSKNLNQIAINSTADDSSSTRLSSTHSTEALPSGSEAVPSQVILNGTLWLLLPVLCVVIWAVFLSVASEAWKVVRPDVKPLKFSDQIPCRNCSFFSRNFYLKCAVRPLDALTDRAIDCSDYCPKKSPQTARQFLDEDVD